MPPKKKPSRKDIVKLNKKIGEEGKKKAKAVSKKVSAKQKAAEDKAIVGRYGKNGSLAKQTKKTKKK